MRVLYRGGIATRSSYGQVCHDYLMALHLAGVPFDVDPISDADTENLPARYAPLLDHLAPEAPFAQGREYTHVIVHTDPNLPQRFLDDVPFGVKKILLTTWEADRIHKREARIVNEYFDALIVPARFNVDLAAQAGIDNRVYCIPHAFDPVWYDHWNMRDAKSTDTYTFYNISTWTPRKNPLAPILAYLAEFRPDENVCFKHVTNDYKRDDILNLMYSGAVRKAPKLEILGVPNRLTDGEMRDLHRTSDCFVTLSRGEAFNLGAFEASLAGNVVVSIGWGGAVEYLNNYPGARFVQHFLTPVLIPPPAKKDPEADRLLDKEMGVGQGVTYGQNWAEPDIHGARRLMREAYESYDRTDYRAGYYDGILDRRFTYEAVGQQFKQVLESI